MRRSDDQPSRADTIVAALLYLMTHYAHRLP